MDTHSGQTPADLTITPRDLRLDREASHPRWWHGGDPVATAYFNALSASFPQGETFFIEAVRRYRDHGDARLQAQIQAFIQQEAAHTREHVAFNKLIKNAGYDTTAMDGETRRRLDIARSRHPLAQLAITVALEHFTAIMAHSLLTTKNPLPGAPLEVLRLWQWHAIEELEHKAVAYDTFLAVTRELSPFKRWALRCHVMLLISAQFWHTNFERMADFFRQDGINTARTWWRVFTYLCFEPGVMRIIFLPYLSFFRPGFHPWNHDDSALIRDFERRLGLASPASAKDQLQADLDNTSGRKIP
jgi:predicted metal-dependent hydrolase